MGTRTTYELTWTPNWPNGHAAAALNSAIVPDPRMEEVAAMMAQLTGGTSPGDDDHEAAAREWDEVLSGDLPASWPDHEGHMAAVSRRWPDTLFSLAMEGGGGDHHMDYYLGGLVQTVQGRVVFPPPETGLMREPWQERQ